MSKRSPYNFINSNRVNFTISISLILLCILLVINYFLQIIFTAQPVYAEEDSLKSVTHRKLNETERGNLSTGCASIQTSLKNLQKIDSKTRVLLGTSYQTILSNYVSPLNIRLIKNNLPDTALITNQSEIINTRNDFSNIFISYSQHLESLITLDCKNQPDNFYAELENVRFLRSKLEESVSKVNNAISKHLKSIEEIKNTLPNPQTTLDKTNIAPPKEAK